MHRFPDPNFSRRAAKSQRRSLWPHREFCHASLPLYMITFCKYQKDVGQQRTGVAATIFLRGFVPSCEPLIGIR